MVIVAGVEEAGRGPVIGPLVMAIVAVEESKLHLLEELGVKDSKLLSAKKRAFLFNEIKKITKYKILITPPKVIDAALNSSDMNLNYLEAKISVKLIKEFDYLNKVILDCPSNNTSSYKDYVASFLDKKIELVVEHKADLNYVVVAAASILAKHTRDVEILKLKNLVGVDFGSGYPSDPKTINFLKENHDKYDFFRKSWKTYKNVLINKSQASLKKF